MVVRWMPISIFSDAFRLVSWKLLGACLRLWCTVCTHLGRIAVAVSCFCQVPGHKSAQSQDRNADHRAAGEAVGLLRGILAGSRCCSALLSASRTRHRLTRGVGFSCSFGGVGTRRETRPTVMERSWC